jgi:GT2 family glycosyltransferase
VRIIETEFPHIKLYKNSANLGYAAAHNQGFFIALRDSFELILILNPDTCLTPDFFNSAFEAIAKNNRYSFYTPKILRTDSFMRPSDPPVIDAAGMIFTPWARHFDRGSEIFDREQYEVPEEVFGGTGAALFIRVADISKLALRGERRDSDKLKIYPELAQGEEERVPVFDEAFFAFREDAELAWRAKNIGLKFLYIPQIVVFHRRTVKADYRYGHSPLVNSWSVRNRFLMQWVNFRAINDLNMILPGIILWNFFVILAVFLGERTSIRGLWESVILIPRALERRRILMSGVSKTHA